MAIFSSPEDMEMIAFMCNQQCLEYHMDGLTIISTEQDRSNYMAWYAKAWAARMRSDPEKLEKRRASKRKGGKVGRPKHTWTVAEAEAALAAGSHRSKRAMLKRMVIEYRGQMVPHA